MGRRLSDYRAFGQEFFRSFQSTGAVAPSGVALCRALARQIVPEGGPLRLLEAGPGTGVVTDQMIRRMGPEDTLDLVELNDRFADILETRRTDDPHWQPAAPRIRIHRAALEEYVAEKPYDVIVSGLPLNNFDVATVQKILQQFHRLARDGGVLSFFEYVGIRNAKALVCRRAERKRLAGVDKVFAEATAAHGFARDLVVRNVPPAWVHHLRLDGTASAADANADAPAP